MSYKYLKLKNGKNVPIMEFNATTNYQGYYLNKMPIEYYREGEEQTLATFVCNWSNAISLGSDGVAGNVYWIDSSKEYVLSNSWKLTIYNVIQWYWNGNSYYDYPYLYTGINLIDENENDITNTYFPNNLTIFEDKKSSEIYSLSMCAVTQGNSSFINIINGSVGSFNFILNLKFFSALNLYYDDSKTYVCISKYFRNGVINYPSSTLTPSTINSYWQLYDNTLLCSCLDAYSTFNNGKFLFSLIQHDIFDSDGNEIYISYPGGGDPDDGNGSNAGQGQNDNNVGGDGSYDNSSDNLTSDDYANTSSDGEESPYPPILQGGWNDGTCLYTMYKMTFSQMSQFLNYLCSSTWQSAIQSLGIGSIFGAVQKVLTYPFDVPYAVRSNSITVMGINTSCTCSGIVHRFAEINCGNITIDRYFGDFKDYAPYTKCYIYLPYIGVNEISINQVQGKALSLVYGVDLLDGSCVARLSADDKQLYSFSGNMATEYPIVGKTPSSPLASATNLLGNISGNDTLVATAGLLGSILTSQNSYSAFQTVGGVAGNWGNVGVLTPFVYIERPVQSIPNAYESSFGWTCNKYLKLDDLTGYTEVDGSIHLSTTATDEEKEMLKEILTGGFYINPVE